MRMISILVLALAGVMNAAYAADDAPSAEDLAKAKEHLRLGKEAYEAENYGLACDEFERAVQYDNKPDFYFNLGLCNEARGNLALAITAYGSFLALAPANHKARSDAAKKLARLEQIQKKVMNGDESPTTPVMSPKKQQSKVLLGVSIGLAAVGAGAAITSGALWSSVENGIAEIPSKCSGFCEEFKAPLRAQEDAAQALIPVAGAAAAGAVVAGAIYGVSGKLPAVLVTPNITPNSAGVTVGGQF